MEKTDPCNATVVLQIPKREYKLQIQWNYFATQSQSYRLGGIPNSLITSAVRKADTKLCH
jgi:hypothetical protein